MIAKDMMCQDVITVLPEERIETVAGIFIEKRISGLPVVDKDKRIVGIITEGDLVYQQKKLNGPVFLGFLDGILQVGQQEFYNELKKMAAYKVEDLMTKDVITVEADTDISDIATLMIEKKIKRVPVIDKDRKILGLITRYDIIKYMYR